MTIRFVNAWNGYYSGQIIDGLGATEENRLIGLGFAVTDLDGPGNNLGGLVQFNADGTALAGPNRSEVTRLRGQISIAAPPAIVFDACDSVTGWTTTGSIIGNSALYPHSGAGSIKNTTASGTVVSAIITKTISKMFNSSEQIVLWVYVPDATYLTQIYIFLSSDAFTVKWMTGTFLPRTASSGPVQFQVHSGWNALTINTAEFASTGAESWANTMNTIRLRASFSHPSARTSDVYWAGVEVQGRRKSKVSFSFDNGHIEQYYAGTVDSIFEIFTRKRGIVGTLAMGGGPIDGTPGSHMTAAQLHAFRDAGWDFASKGYANTGVLSAVGDLAGDMAAQKAWYAARGITENGVVVAYGGSMTTTVAATLAGLGYKGARLYNPTAFALNRLVNGFANPWWVESIPLSSALSLAAAQVHIDNAIAYGYNLNFTGHKVKVTADTEAWTPGDLATLADYAIEKQNSGAIDIVSLGYLFDNYA